MSHPVNLRSSLLLWGATLALGCGAPSGGSGLGLDIYLSRAVADELGTFQVVVLPDGRSRKCGELQSTCLNQQIKSTDALLIKGPEGKEVRAVRFPVNLANGAQQLELDVPVGRNYVVVIEALSRSSPPRFLGSSCNYLESVSATHNDTLITTPITLAANSCDPTIAP